MTMMTRQWLRPLLFSATIIAALGTATLPLRAQTNPAEAADSAEQAPEPLSPEELEILVARIALYPDELVALVSAASLYPLQIVEAERFLEDLKTNKTLKPKATWDGSVVSLLNYPELVKMMSEDLDWTQLLGESIVNQQDEVLAAIQQLREEAVANGVIKTDDKVKVVKEVEDGRQNIVIQPASSEVIYVPQYNPEMLYEPNYTYVPVSYYPDPYPYYWNPAATFFAGAVTGAIWAGAVDWNDGFWGGDWHHGNGWHGNNNVDIDIDCNKCIIGNDFSGKLNINDVDWRKVDRSKVNFNNNQFTKLDNTQIKDSFKNVDRDKLTNKATNIKGDRPTTLPGKGTIQTKDIRKSTLEGLNKQPVKDFKPTDKMARPGNGSNIGDKVGKPGNAANIGDKVGKPGNLKPSDKMAKPNLDRPVGKPKPGLDQDVRPKTPSPLGEVTRGRDAKAQSNRGNKAMGGGASRPNFNPGGGGGGGGSKKFVPKHNMGGGGGGRSGGGGGGGRGHRR
ncbi:DUF3300 domain-containing protein [Aestuariivirga sp.]|uniref:DUF3300 domain-containing protein n=1 Tax=Aestuariivirga sp. TaxID=2650926 RepID=UPI003BA891EC